MTVLVGSPGLGVVGGDAEVALGVTGRDRADRAALDQLARDLLGVSSSFASRGISRLNGLSERYGRQQAGGGFSAAKVSGSTVSPHVVVDVVAGIGLVAATMSAIRASHDISRESTYAKPPELTDPFYTPAQMEFPNTSLRH